MTVPFAPHSTAARPEWYEYLDCEPWNGGDPSKPSIEEFADRRVEKPVGAPESWLANVLLRAMHDYIRRNRLGASYINMPFELTAVGTRRKPNVAFVSVTTWPPDRTFPRVEWWAVTPDLAVEVVSPYELTHATLAKVQEYFAAGVKAVWLVLPNVEQVYCYSTPTAVRVLSRADDLIGDPVLPGFRLPLAELFPPPPADPAPPGAP